MQVLLCVYTNVGHNLFVFYVTSKITSDKNPEKQSTSFGLWKFLRVSWILKRKIFIKQPVRDLAYYYAMTRFEVFCAILLIKEFGTNSSSSSFLNEVAFVSIVFKCTYIFIPVPVLYYEHVPKEIDDTKTNL